MDIPEEFIIVSPKGRVVETIDPVQRIWDEGGKILVYNGYSEYIFVKSRYPECEFKVRPMYIRNKEV